MPTANSILPAAARRWLRAQQRRYRLHWRPFGTVQFGHLRRLTPISCVFGLDRGQPIDRYYIERFLAEHAVDIRGRVLEMGDAFYTRKFGGNRFDRSDILHPIAGNAAATLIADLARADHISSDLFDAIICTQTLQMIYDIHPAIRHLHRILKPGGVLLVTSGQISKIARREERDPWGEYWHFTAQGARRAFHEVFPKDHVGVEVYGNVLSAVAFLHGLAMDELSREELDQTDPDYEVIVAVRAVKPLPTL